MKNWYNIDKNAVLDEYRVDRKTGLSSQEVSDRQLQSGLNKFDEKKKESIVMAVLRQLKDVSVIVLLIAAALSFALALQEGEGFIEPVVILSIVVMNVILAITQERGAEKAVRGGSGAENVACVKMEFCLALPF